MNHTRTHTHTHSHTCDEPGEAEGGDEDGEDGAQHDQTPAASRRRLHNLSCSNKHIVAINVLRHLSWVAKC